MSKVVTIELTDEQQRMVEELIKYKSKEESVDYDNPDVSYTVQDIIEESLEHTHKKFFSLVD